MERFASFLLRAGYSAIKSKDLRMIFEPKSYHSNLPCQAESTGHQEYLLLNWPSLRYLRYFNVWVTFQPIRLFRTTVNQFGLENWLVNQREMHFSKCALLSTLNGFQMPSGIIYVMVYVVFQDISPSVELERMPVIFAGKCQKFWHFEKFDQLLNRIICIDAAA